MFLPTIDALCPPIPVLYFALWIIDHNGIVDSLEQLCLFEQLSGLHRKLGFFLLGKSDVPQRGVDTFLSRLRHKRSRERTAGETGLLDVYQASILTTALPKLGQIIPSKNCPLWVKQVPKGCLHPIYPPCPEHLLPDYVSPLHGPACRYNEHGIRRQLKEVI